MVATALRVVAVAVLVFTVTATVAGGVSDANHADAQDCPDEGNLCAAFPDDAVGVSDWPYRTNLTVAGDVSVVEITEDELNANQLVDIFGGHQTDGAVRVTVGEDGAIPAEFDYSDGGNHTFHVRAVKAKRTVRANRTADADLLLVGEPPTVYLSTDFPVVERGGTVRIGLEFDDAAVGNVTVAGEGVRLKATLRDDDRDGSAGLLIDSDALEDRAGAVRVVGADRLLTVNVSAANATLSTGTYDLSAGIDGRETAIGLLKVVRRTETTSSTRTTSSAAAAQSTSVGTREPTSPGSTEVESTGEPTADADVPAQESDTSERIGSPRGTEPRGESTRSVPGFGVGSALVALALCLARLWR
ncbi:hypothetical protein [Halorussus litoreus]|uniref:hypothetical protein n=1 Tax=Halorussus litoreus TaxID=1710536 RepID=UPI000E254C2A|nr:hypothetical protein [Halorussus litoreus]